MENTSLRLRMSSKGILGLTNIGNTCYGNATLQALRHQVDFTIFLLQDQHKEILQRKSSSEKTKLLEAYSELTKSLWANDSGCIPTKDFWGTMIPAAIQSGFEQFRIPMAHDAHEFLVFLLDQFHEAMAEGVTMTIRSSSQNKDTRGALEAWKSSFEKSYSPLVELIFGLQRKCVKCEQCKAESISWETFNILEVSVPKQSTDPVNLLQLLSAESKDDRIEGYHCETCPTRTNAAVFRNVWRLGNWVIVVLKRNENSGRRINTLVEIPLTTSFQTIFHPSSSEPSAKDSYELFATIHHHGSSGGGHYTAQAKHPVSGKWAHFDDEMGREIQQPLLDASTYIVMYRRNPSSNP
jgi:ubiquitin carboxyl-terminal hydrolase 8